MTGATTQRPAWLAEELAGLLRLVHSALQEVTGALLDEPADAEERARTAAKTIGSVRHTMEEDADAFTPAPTLLGPELSPLLLGVHVGTEIEALSDVTVQLVELAWLRRDRAPLPARLLAPLREMAAVTLDLVASAAAALEPQALAVPTVQPDPGVLTQDQQRLYAGLFKGHQPVGSADATDAVLVSCRLVRAAHHAESVIAQAGLLRGPARDG